MNVNVDRSNSFLLSMIIAGLISYKLKAVYINQVFKKKIRIKIIMNNTLKNHLCNLLL